MGRSPCCSKEGLNRGAWTSMEDEILTDYIKVHGEGKWRNLPKRAGLQRCGKSCRLRWLNYLRPDIKRGNITRDEEDLIIRLHKLLGNRWSLIAGRLPGRTDNEIKNYWNTKIGKKVRAQPTFTSNRKSSIQFKGKPSPRLEQSIRQRPASPITGSGVIRAEASRCTKVFINTEPQRTQRLDQKPVVGVEPSTTEDMVNDSAVVSKPFGGVSPFISTEDNTSDLEMDFEIDEKILSYFLNTELIPLCDQLDYEITGVTNTNTNDTSHSSPNSNKTIFSSIETQHDSDLGSMTSLLDPETNWLQDY